MGRGARRALRSTLCRLARPTNAPASAKCFSNGEADAGYLPLKGLSYSHILLTTIEADSMDHWLIRGGAHGWDGIRTGAVWRPSSGKRGANLHAALVARPCPCIKRLAGTRAREIQFTRLLRNHSVTADEMTATAAERTAIQAAGRDVVVIQDTSELSLGGRRAKANGYGPVGKGGALRGLLLHAVLAVDAGSAAVIGLVEVKARNRKGGKVKSRPRGGQQTRNRNAGSMGRGVPGKSWLGPKASQVYRIGRATFTSTSRAARRTCI